MDEAPNYYKIIKKPMDLSTLKQNLDDGDVNNAEEVTLGCLLHAFPALPECALYSLSLNGIQLWENLLLIFNNAFTFNSKNSAVYYKAQKLKEFAQKEMESVLEVSLTPIPIGALPR